MGLKRAGWLPDSLVQTWEYRYSAASRQGKEVISASRSGCTSACSGTTDPIPCGRVRWRLPDWNAVGRFNNQTLAAALLSILLCTSPGLARGSKASNSSKGENPECKQCTATAASLFAQGKTSAAVALLNQWTDKCPKSSQLHLLLSTILLRVGDKTGAETEAGLAATAAPTSVAAHMQYGLTLLGNQHYKPATAEFEQVTELDPASYEAWSSLSMLHQQLHQNEEAARCAQKASDLEPGARATRMATLLNLKRAGNYTKAKSEVQHLLADGSASPEQMEDIAREAIAVGAFPEAVTACTKVASAYPKAQTPVVMLALAHYCLGDFASCGDDAEKLLLIDSKNAEGAALKALALAKQNKLDDADAAMKGLKVGDSSSSVVFVARGTIDFLRGSYAESGTNLQNCLEADASNTALQGIPHALARITLSQLYTKTGRAKDATEQAKALAGDKRFADVASGLQK